MIYSEELYEDLLQEIFAKHPSVQNIGFEKGAYKPGLQAMEDFHLRLGSPANKLKIIHIAGTNGKGSVSSFIAAALAAAGYKVGLYTSPHLVDFRERIKIIQNAGYKMISKEDVFNFIAKNNLDGLSFFEITTGLAFEYFADQKVDYAVIETGLGGRLDSTNIVTPILSVITSIGLDHCALLGSTLSEIAREKAGIIKPNVPVVIGEECEETAEVFWEVAKERKAPISFTNEAIYDLGGFDLIGPYQNRNLCTVLEALKILGIKPDMGALAKAAKITGFRGRWEILKEVNPQIICDIGHNPAALKINFEKLKSTGCPLYIVYGVMSDKDYKSIRELMPEDAHYYAVVPKNERALPVEKLATILEGLDFVTASSVSEGVKMAINDASKVRDSIVYIGGSNFVVAEIEDI